MNIKQNTKTQEEYFMVRKEFLSAILMTLLLAAWLVPPTAQAESRANKDGSKRLNKVQTNGVYSPMDINNVFNYYSNDGDGSFNPYSSSAEGFEFPIGQQSATCIFEDGLVWTAFKNDTLYCGGSTYNHGLQAGRIITAGTATTAPVADDPGSAANRIYRVRPDMRPTTNADTIALETSVLQTSEVGYINQYPPGSASANGLLQQYWADWNNWPAAQGAPYTDVNGDGVYEANIDIPGFPGADQTQWMVMNDLNPALTINLYNSNPIGIEVQRTIWAYNRPGALGSTIFLSYKFINKSGQPLDSMYVSQWCDPDLGAATDDATGCDTLLSLGYVYNGEPRDANFASANLPPPAAGFDFFQGPKVAGLPADTAIFDLKHVGGYKNLPMTAFGFFINGNPTFGDPNLGSNGPVGSFQWYNLMRGLVTTTGLPFPTAVTGGTKFCYPGDPVTGVGPTYIGPARVSPPADVRMALCSGPFSMQPGDTQEVVVAALAAYGSDNISSVSVLKYNDQLAQTAYNFFFNLPNPPPSPNVKVAQLDGKIVLSWGDQVTDAAEESFVDKGYAFQGYNVYQLPSNSPSGAKRLATYDITTSQGIISDLAFDPGTGFVITKPVQFGSRQGVQHSITITQDAFTAGPIIDNRDYFFAVTAYSYNGAGAEPNNLESSISGHIQDVRAEKLAPGVTAAATGAFTNIVHTGTADAKINVNVVNPPLVTGDQYKVSFHDEQYTLGSSGVWTDITPPVAKRKGLNKSDTLTGSSLSASGVWTDLTKTGFTIHNAVSVVSVDFDYCDGISITFPAGLVIDTIFAPTSLNSSVGGAISYTYNHGTNTATFGTMTGHSTNGVFAGGEDIVVLSHGSPTLPIVMSYTMHDDGYGGGPIDVTGSDTLTSIANQLVTQHQWNLTDVATGNIVLKNQTIYGGVDSYDQTTFFKANGFYGPGGSSGTIGHNVGVNPIDVNGLQVTVSGSFVAPITQGNVILNGKALGYVSADHEWEDANGNWGITDFTDFGNADGSAAGSIINYVAGGGVPLSNIAVMQQDYELRWTGVLGDTVIGTDTVIITKSGGSIATLIGVHSPATMATHPLNPNPGSSAPFTVRIPFEVWCTDKNEQVNLLFYDRKGNPANPGFAVWDMKDRVYAWVLSTKYTGSTTPFDPTTAAVKDSLTWNWVFWACKFTTGDDVKIIYNNPLQIGQDAFTFTVPQVNYSASLAKADISQINVFPNPYFGFNRLEASKYDRWVRFTHLPSSATIRIFNLAGILVRTIVKNDLTQFSDWDLLNEHKLPVAAGMYIAYIDCGSLGTKTLKLAIIPEQQFLDHY